MMPRTCYPKRLANSVSPASEMATCMWSVSAGFRSRAIRPPFQDAKLADGQVVIYQVGLTTRRASLTASLLVAGDR